MSNLRVYLVGQKWLGAETLDLCRRLGVDVVGVCAPLFTDDGRMDRLRTAAADLGLTVCDPRSLRPAVVPEGTDLLVAAHAHVFITRELREATRLGAIGYHPSLLPRHRGRDAVRWAIHMREPITGGTVYWMTDAADAGPIAAQEWCHIRKGDKPEALWRRELAPMGHRLFDRVLRDVAAGRIVRRPQDEQVATWEPSFKRGSLASRGRLAKRAAPVRGCRMKGVAA